MDECASSPFLERVSRRRAVLLGQHSQKKSAKLMRWEARERRGGRIWVAISFESPDWSTLSLRRGLSLIAGGALRPIPNRAKKVPLSGELSLAIGVTMDGDA